MTAKGASAKPLGGRTVLVTRARSQASHLAELLTAAGAEVVFCPSIQIIPPESFASLDAVIHSASAFDWIVFTSTNGVDAFFARARETGRVVRLTSATRVAAVGRSTAKALEKAGITPAAVPQKFQAGELAPLLGADQRGVRTAIVRAERGREELIDELRARGGEVHLAIAYRTIGAPLPADTRERIASGSIDAVTFTSPSTVDNLVHALDEHSRETLLRARLVSIGPVTTEAIRVLGVEPVEAKEASMQAVVDAVIAALRH